MKNHIVELTSFETGYLIGMLSKDSNIPRSLWIKLHIAATESYLEHPVYAAEAKKNIERWRQELIELVEQKTELNNQVEPVKTPKEPMWRTKDGREMPIRLMTDDHLLRSIALLRRKALEKVLFNDETKSTKQLLDKTKISLLEEEARRR